LISTFSADWTGWGALNNSEEDGEKIERQKNDEKEPNITFSLPFSLNRFSCSGNMILQFENYTLILCIEYYWP
jgi:hypothetical protein